MCVQFGPKGLSKNVWRPDLPLLQFDQLTTMDYTYLRCEIGTSTLSDHEPELYWDSTYAIVVSLMEHFPDRAPVEIGLEELIVMVESLPGYQDDTAMVTEQLLLDILTVWYEEAT